MKNLRNTRGITLIALVITIVVLLILAGVSIAMLTGDNGILIKASSAKEKSAQAEAEELVKLAILASYGQDGEIDLEELRENLNNIQGLNPKIEGDIEIGEDGFTVTVNRQYVKLTKTENTITASVTGTAQTPTVPEKVSLTGIEIPEGKEEITIIIGEEENVEINATMEPSNAEDELIYSSSDETKAIVDKNGKITGLSSGEVTITISGKEAIAVTKEIKVTVVKIVTAAQIAEKPEDYYGKQVINYKASESDSNVYRIFYVDEAGDFGGVNTVYLKADYSGNYTLSTFFETYDPINTKLEIMNPEWYNKRGKETWNDNEKAAAYLCSPVFANEEGTIQNSEYPWANYYKKEYANYVIGGPSIEMYVKSYNQVPHDNLSYKVIGAKYTDTKCPGYMYTLDGIPAADSNFWTGSNTIDYSLKYNSMYCGKDGKKNLGWYIASPHAYTSGGLCFADGTDASLNGGYVNQYGLSPLVSLKSEFSIQIAE